jgi:hypothetical protein
VRHGERFGRTDDALPGDLENASFASQHYHRAHQNFDLLGKGQFTQEQLHCPPVADAPASATLGRMLLQPDVVPIAILSTPISLPIENPIPGM